MNKIILLFLLFSQKAWGQVSSTEILKLQIRDTTLLIAKEYCSNSSTVCWFGDDLHLNRMIVYNDCNFWKNYSSMLFYFTGLDLRNFQEKNDINYVYLEKAEQLLLADVENDSNKVIILNEMLGSKNIKKRTDTIQYKIYKMKFQYVFWKKSDEYIPNFFSPFLSSTYIYSPVNTYFITKIDSISPYNKLLKREWKLKRRKK